MNLKLFKKLLLLLLFSTIITAKYISLMFFVLVNACVSCLVQNSGKIICSSIIYYNVLMVMYITYGNVLMAVRLFFGFVIFII